MGTTVIALCCAQCKQAVTDPDILMMADAFDWECPHCGTTNEAMSAVHATDIETGCVEQDEEDDGSVTIEPLTEAEKLRLLSRDVAVISNLS